MRRVDGFRLLALALQLAAGKPRISSALGAVTVQDVNLELGGVAGDPSGDAPVAETDIVGHGHTGQPKHAIVGQAPECNRIALGAGIADEADFGPKLSLAQHEIVDVPEQAPCRRAQTMQNTKRGQLDPVSKTLSATP